MQDMYFLRRRRVGTGQNDTVSRDCAVRLDDDIRRKGKPHVICGDRQRPKRERGEKRSFVKRKFRAEPETYDGDGFVRLRLVARHIALH